MSFNDPGLTPPITRNEILAGVHHAFQLEQNEVQLRPKPRASGLFGDAREIAYSMAGTPISDDFSDYEKYPDHVDGAFTQEQGRLAEDITCAAIDVSGAVTVINRQISLPEDYFVTGHPDGEMGWVFFNPHAEEPKRDIGTVDADGKKWGFEHKHFGRFKIKELAKEGLWGAAPEIIGQMTMYGDALGWDYALLVVTSQDASSMRFEFRSKAMKDLNFHPKMEVFSVDLRPHYEELLPFLKKRAEWFSEWFKNSGDPRDVAIEAKKLDGFPWSYSEYQTLAKADGQSGEKAPGLPVYRNWAE